MLRSKLDLKSSNKNKSLFKYNPVVVILILATSNNRNENMILVKNRVYDEESETRLPVFVMSKIKLGPMIVMRWK